MICIKLKQNVYVAVSRLGCCLCENYCVCVNCVYLSPLVCGYYQGGTVTPCQVFRVKRPPKNPLGYQIGVETEILE